MKKKVLAIALVTAFAGMGVVRQLTLLLRQSLPGPQPPKKTQPASWL